MATAFIAGVSITISLVGLELGDRLGAITEKWSEEIGGAVLVFIGAMIASGAF